MSLIFSIRKPTRTPNTFFQLSDAAFKTEEEKEWYRRAGRKIKRFKAPRADAMNSYPRILVEPSHGWWPSQYASFKIAKKIDMLWLVGLLPQECNTSVWESKDRYPTLRVPRDWKIVTKRLLHRNGLCYNRTDNLWRQREAFDKWLRKEEKRNALQKPSSAG